APSLKGPPLLPPRRHDLVVEHQTTTADPLIVGEGLNADQLLAAADNAFHHPVERPAREQFICPLRRHPRHMREHLRLLQLLLFGKALRLPPGKICDIVRTDTELHEMNRHPACSSKPTSGAPAST